MLKFPVLTERRRRLAHVVVVALLFGAGYASWAAQPGTASPTQASASSLAHGQIALAGEAPVVADKPATSIQLGELQNIAPSADISYRRMTPPSYPPEAKHAHVGAKVVLKVLIDTEGRVKSAEVEKIALIGEPRPDPVDGKTADKATLTAMFADVAKTAVRSWSYQPGMKGGKPTEGYALIPIDFSMDHCDADKPCSDKAKPAPAKVTGKKATHA